MPKLVSRIKNMIESESLKKEKYLVIENERKEKTSEASGYN